MLPCPGHAIPPYTSACNHWGHAHLFSPNSCSDEPGDQLRHVSEIQKTPQRQSTNCTSSVPAARTHTSTTTLPMYIGGGIPPIPEN